MKNCIIAVVLIVVGCLFVGCAPDQKKLTVDDNRCDRSNKTILGDRLLYNGDGTYTLFVLGHTTWPVHLRADDMTLVKDAAPDKPISADMGSIFDGWNCRYNKIVIHLHDAREIGGAGWTHQSGKNTHIHHNVGVVE